VNTDLDRALRVNPAFQRLEISSTGRVRVHLMHRYYTDDVQVQLGGHKEMSSISLPTNSALVIRVQMQRLSQ
jgi:hypothetical protein